MTNDIPDLTPNTRLPSQGALLSPPKSQTLFWVTAALGTLFSGLALISIASRAWKIGLAPVLTGILDTYRAMMRPVSAVLLAWVSWAFPDWSIPDAMGDMVALSCLFAAARARAIYLFETERRYTRWDYVKASVSTFAIGVSLLGIFIPIRMFVRAVSPIDRIIAFAQAEARYNALNEYERDRPFNVKLFGEVVDLGSISSLEYFQRAEISTQRSNRTFARNVVALILVAAIEAAAFFAVNSVIYK